MIWLWVWTISECEGGDIEKIVARAKALGVGLIVKTHDGTTHNPNGASALALIARCRQEGIPVRAWGYCYPDVDLAEQAVAAAYAGVDYIADVEGEWDGLTDRAQQLVDALRSQLGRHLIGYAPLPIIDLHEGADLFGHAQYGAFNQLDLACPQAYAGTGGRDAIGALTWTDDQWQHAFPAGVRLEPAVYGADQPGKELLRAIGWVRSKARTFGYTGDVSVWSWQHLSVDAWEAIAWYSRPAPVVVAAVPPIPAQATPPAYAGQSADLRVKAGEVGYFVASWAYVDGIVRPRDTKAYAHSPGRYPIDLYPLAEDQTTEHRDAVPARWFLDVTL